MHPTGYEGSNSCVEVYSNSCLGLGQAPYLYLLSRKREVKTSAPRGLVHIFYGSTHGCYIKRSTAACLNVCTPGGAVISSAFWLFTFNAVFNNGWVG